MGNAKTDYNNYNNALVNLADAKFSIFHNIFAVSP